MKAARVLLANGLAPLAVVAMSVLTQRLLLPFAALHLENRASAVAALLGAAALGFVRTRAADRLARVVRLNLLELHLGPFVRGPVAALPSSDVVTARLATDLSLLVSWAVDGVALVLAAAVAIPAVIVILTSAIGVRVLVPIGVAGIVGAATTMAASRSVTATWTASWERARAFITAMASGYDGAVDLRAHGRADAYAGRLRDDMRAWCHAEGRAHLASTVSTWGAFGATLATAAAVVELSGGTLAPNGDPYRTSLLVLAAVPTLHTLASGVSHLLAAREALAAVGRHAAAAAASEGRAESDEPIDAAAEIRFEGIGYTYPARGEDDAWQAPTAAGSLVRRPATDGSAVVALDGVDLVLPARGSVAITGPNGAGKTTLAHVLVGVVPPDRGRILVAERETHLDNRRFRARIAYLSQRPFEMSEGTIADNLRAFDATIADERLLDALATVGLLELLRARVASDGGVLALPFRALSRGQARRVMLARALLRDAALLVLDEPEAHLDAASSAQLSAILRRVAGERRVVAVIHDRQLLGFADHVIELAPPGARAP